MDRFYDEAFDGLGTAAPALRERRSGALDALDLSEVADRVTDEIDGMGVAFGSPPEPSPSTWTPCRASWPRREWDLVERALCAARARAARLHRGRLRRARGSSSEGVVPGARWRPAPTSSPGCSGWRCPSGPTCAVAGMDLVRGADGTLAVLEDNVRTPSGLTYAVAARTRWPTVTCLAAAARAPLAGRRRSTGSARPCARRARTATAIRTWCCSPTVRRTAPGTSTARSPGSLGIPLVEPERPRAEPRAGSSRVDGRRSARGRRALPAHRRGPAHGRARRLDAARPTCCSSPAARAGCVRQRLRHRARRRQARSTPTSRTWSASTSTRSRCCARSRATTSASRSARGGIWSGSTSW